MKKISTFILKCANFLKIAEIGIIKNSDLETEQQLEAKLLMGRDAERSLILVN